MNERSDICNVAGTPHSRPLESRSYAAAHNAEVMRWVPCDARTVLDVGCGAGGNAAYLARSNVTVDGVTISMDEARHARSSCRHLFLHDLEQGLPAQAAGPYDAVLCSHILEHICYPQRLLLDIHGRLRPGGRLIAAIPNLLYYKSRLQLLRGRFEYQTGGIMDDTHFRWYTLPTITRLLRAHQFTIERSYGTGGIGLGPLRRLAPALCRGIEQAAARASPGLFAWQLLVVATRA